MDSNSDKILLDPKVIPKFVRELPIPPVFNPIIRKDDYCNVYYQYNVSINELKAQVLPEEFPKTTLLAYGGLIKGNSVFNETSYSYSVPGPTFEAIRNVPIYVNWINELSISNPLPVDPTLHWADPNKVHGHFKPPFPSYPPGFPSAQYPIPIVTHLHGGEVSPPYDGYPDSWFTYNGIHGNTYDNPLYEYPNSQPPTTLWYHDHTMGITRLNVYAGLSGLYIIRDYKNPLDNPKTTPFPKGKYEIPLIIQDKSFYADGSLCYPTKGNNPSIHPYWTPLFFGNTIVVNGATWPNLNVEKRPYRFRILNGSNARFFMLKLSNNQSFIQIGSDGGYLPKPLEIRTLFIAPAERVDVIIDFSDIKLNTKILLQNFSPAPYPFGTNIDSQTTGQIMQFTINSHPTCTVNPLELPEKLNVLPTLIPNRPKRILTLNVIFENDNPNALALLLDGQKWVAPVSQKPQVGSTEIWEFVNLTADSHPMHIHLVQFQLMNRQYFNVSDYSKVWIELNPTLPLINPTKPLPVDKYLQGTPIPPEPNEIAWKDTIKVFPNQVTRVLVRFAPLDSIPCKVKPGINLYPFDPTESPGYAWHCHMLEHEDNEMMRPMYVIN